MKVICDESNNSEKDKSEGKLNIDLVPTGWEKATDGANYLAQSNHVLNTTLKKDGEVIIMGTPKTNKEREEAKENMKQEMANIVGVPKSLLFPDENDGGIGQGGLE